MTSIITKMKVLQLVILCLSGKVVVGHESGAPSKTCHHMAPGHLGTRGFIPRRDLSLTPYEVKAKIDGRYVRLFVNGSVSVAGFLIQARETPNGPAIGKFKLESLSNNSVAQYQKCEAEEFPPFSSITHRNSSPKYNLAFLWSPITNRAENITVTFYATLAQSREMFWVMQPSNEINILDINGTPGRPLIPFWTLSSLVVAFMIHSLIQ